MRFGNGSSGGGRRRSAKRLSNVFVETVAALQEVYADAAQIDLPEARVVVGWELVRTIGRNINSVSLERKRLSSLNEAALAQFDADLAGLRARYARVYKPIFERLVQVHPEDWSDEDWAEYDLLIEEPILRCDEASPWPKNVPACRAPDLLTSFSLLNQAFAAREVQIELGTSVLERIGAVVEQMGRETKGVIKQAVEGLVVVVEAGIEAIETAAKEAVRGAAGVAGRHLWIVPALLGAGYLWIRGRKR